MRRRAMQGRGNLRYGEAITGRRRAAGLLAAALLAALASAPVAAQMLSVTLASQPVERGLISTAQSEERNFRVLSGSTLRFSRERGRDSRLVAGGGFYWTQVEDIPRDAERLELTPTLRDDGQIDVRLMVDRKVGDDRQRVDTSLRVASGAWSPVYAPATASTPGQRVYGSQRRDDSLYLRVAVLP